MFTTFLAFLLNLCGFASMQPAAGVHGHSFNRRSAGFPSATTGSPSGSSQAALGWSASGKRSASSWP